MIRPFLLLILAVTVLSGCGESFLPQAHRTAHSGMEAYQAQLTAKLLRQHRNNPVYGDRVYRVELEMSKDIKQDVEGNQYKVEWSQLVYDRWDHRIPELEKEFFVVVFGKPGDPASAYRRVHNVKPSITVGLSARGNSGENSPISNFKSAMGGQYYCPACGNAVPKPGICPACLKHDNAATSTPTRPTVQTESGLNTDRAVLGISAVNMARRRIRTRPAVPVTESIATTPLLIPPKGSAITPSLRRLRPIPSLSPIEQHAVLEATKGKTPPLQLPPRDHVNRKKAGLGGITHPSVSLPRNTVNVEVPVKSPYSVEIIRPATISVTRDKKIDEDPQRAFQGRF